jgi:hypothetical protein
MIRPPARDLQFYALDMNVLKNVFLVVGLLAVAGAVAILVKNAWDLRILYEVPTNLVLIGAGVGLLGGILLGLGIGLPRRTASAIRHDTIEELHRATADAALAAAAVTEPVDEPRVEPTA